MINQSELSIQLDITSYFNEYYKQNVVIPLFKDEVMIPIKLDQKTGMFIKTTKKKATRLQPLISSLTPIYDTDVFDKLYGLKLANQTAPEKLFVALEIAEVKNRFNEEIRNKYKLIEYWLYFLNERLSKSNLKQSQNISLNSYNDLFKSSGNADEVKRILEKKGYTTKGVWVGLSGNKTELLSAYYILKQPCLKPGKITTQATIFYREFGLIVGEYISERSLRIPPKDNIDSQEFKKIFNYIITS